VVTRSHIVIEIHIPYWPSPQLRTEFELQLRNGVNVAQFEQTVLHDPTYQRYSAFISLAQLTVLRYCLFIAAFYHTFQLAGSFLP
jgi:hypothetical protein